VHIRIAFLAKWCNWIAKFCSCVICLFVTRVYCNKTAKVFVFHCKVANALCVLTGSFTTKFEVFLEHFFCFNLHGSLADIWKVSFHFHALRSWFRNHKRVQQTASVIGFKSVALSTMSYSFVRSIGIISYLIETQRSVYVSFANCRVSI